MNDHALLQSLSKGEERGYRELVRMYLPRLVSFLSRFVYNREVVAELAQDTFIKVWNVRASLDLTKNLNSFIYTIAQNKAYDYLRKERSKPEHISLSEISAVYPKNNVVEAEFSLSGLDTSESYIRERLKGDINKLPEQQRKIVTLRLEQNLSSQEIANELGLAKNTVKNHLIRAIKTLQKSYSSFEGLVITGFLLLL